MNNKESTYYFGEVSKVEIKEDELLDVFAAITAPGPSPVKYTPFTPVMVAPGPSPSTPYTPGSGY